MKIRILLVLFVATAATLPLWSHLKAADTPDKAQTVASPPARSPTPEALSTPAYQVGDRLEHQATPLNDGFRTITFDDLMPLDWDPNAIFSELELDKLEDNDPRTMEVMEKIKQAWEQAPVVPALSGQKIRMAGFLVRLEGDETSIREFLLVPYFGACIHVPPPPANQVVHVVPDAPVPAGPGMEVVWVSGTLHLAADKTDLGDAGYRLAAVKVEPYIDE